MYKKVWKRIIMRFFKIIIMLIVSVIFAISACFGMYYIKEFVNKPKKFLKQMEFTEIETEEVFEELKETKKETEQEIPVQVVQGQTQQHITAQTEQIVILDSGANDAPFPITIYDEYHSDDSIILD